MVLIDKESLIENMRKAYKGNIENGFKWDLISAVVVIEVEEEITPDAEPIRHGHWMMDKGYNECSLCGCNEGITPYCPYCGAKMDEVEE